MNAYKLILTGFLLFMSMTSIGQINPINDLYYQQTYMFGNYNCPTFNCFVISWSTPNSSSDTLKGYNVYRNNDFWIFTENTEINCSGYEPCEYIDFFDPIPFWITVKSVYNSDSIISIANDSVYVGEIWITIDEIEKNKIDLLKNPISIDENISIIIQNSEGKTCEIQIHSLNGQLIKEYKINEVMNGIVNISTNKMTPGLYILSILLNGEYINKKIIID